jgi:hypothetical protein
MHRLNHDILYIHETLRSYFLSISNKNFLNSFRKVNFANRYSFNLLRSHFPPWFWSYSLVCFYSETFVRCDSIRR